MAVIPLVPRSASQIIGVVPVDTRDGYGFSLGVGAYRVKALNSASTWYWATTDELAPGAMNEVLPGVEVSFTGPQTAVYCKGTEPISLQVTFDPPLAVIPPDGGFPGAKTIIVGKAGDDTEGADDPYANEFLTIQAAITAATAGDTVIVRPGTYSPAGMTTLKTGVGLHFLLGASMVGAAGSSIFYDGGVAITCRITGDGLFTCGSDCAFATLDEASNLYVDGLGLSAPTAGAASQAIFQMGGSGAKTIRLRMRDISSANDLIATGNAETSAIIEADVIACTAGILAKINGAGAHNFLIAAKRSITGKQLIVDSGSDGATRVSMKAPSITATGAGLEGISLAHSAAARYDVDGDVVRCAIANRIINAAAELHVSGRSIQSHAGSGGSGLNLQKTAKTFLRCDEMAGIAGAPQAIYMQETAELHILGGRIRGLDGDAGGHAILTSGAGPKIRLYPGTVLIAGDDVAAVSIEADNTPTVICMGDIAANKAANVGVVEAVGSLLVDAAVV